jgi:hypothetical protein
MASKLPVPGTGMTADPTDPKDLAMTAVLLVGGFVVLLLSFGMANDATGIVSGAIESLTGYSPSSSDGGTSIRVG